MSDAPEFPEQGIDIEAVSGANEGIRIEWLMNELPEDLAGFYVYRSEDPDSVFERLDFDPLSFLDDLQAEYYYAVDRDTWLRPWTQSPARGHRAWYCVTAIDDSGNESAPSDTVHYQMWDYCRISQTQVSLSADSLFVEWQFDHGQEWFNGLQGLMCFVTPASGDSVSWSAFIQQDLDQQTFSFQWHLEQEMGLIPGDYLLRVDTVIDPGSNSEALSNPNGCAPCRLRI